MLFCGCYFVIVINLSVKDFNCYILPHLIISKFPNPAQNVLYVQAQSSAAYERKIELINLQGRIVQAQILASGDLTSRFDVSHLASGIYAIRWTDRQHSGVRKVIVMH